MENTWELKKAIAQIESCNFQCEAGPLTLNQAFIWLKGAAKACPDFLPGQGVYFEIEAVAAGQKLTQWTHFYIVGCQMESDAERRYFTYDLSCDPPAPYHYGTVSYHGVKAEKLRLERPIK